MPSFYPEGNHGRRTAAPPVMALAKVFIWSFFLLIADQALVIIAFKFGAPIKPAYFYAAIAGGLLGSTLLTGGDIRDFGKAKQFFVPFVALVVISAVMYRGEMPGPDIDEMTLFEDQIPTSIGYVIWPALNVVAASGLYLAARQPSLRATIVTAAFVALVLQIVTMEADMWWPALFGDPNGRAGGLAENANVAAQLVVVLASLTISSRLAPYAVTLALAGVFLSQSKSGALALLILLAFFALSTARRSIFARPVLAFAAGIALLIAGTVAFSPVLNPTPEMIAEAAAKIAQRSAHRLAAARLDRPLTLRERIEARASIDESTALRMAAARTFLGLVAQHPLGLGTGFTNRFATGPHNELLKLAVDNGILAPFLFLVMLGYATWRAYEARSPLLGSLVLVTWSATAFSHTLVVDPFVLPAIGFGLGAIKPVRCAPAGGLPSPGAGP
jgi:hypothetical protein